MSIQLVAPAAPVSAAEIDTTFDLLAAGIPLTLLLDLATGPHSAQLYTDERADVAWVPIPRKGN